MRIVSISEAKIHFSRLIGEAADGKPFIISKAGKPLVKVIRIEMPDTKKVCRSGFMAGEIDVPDDFDRMFNQEIEQMFSAGK